MKPTTKGHLRWTVATAARPGEPGVAVVDVVARNVLVPELAFDMTVDWHPGAEAPDVEGRALAILALLFTELANECKREARTRFTTGHG